MRFINPLKIQRGRPQPKRKSPTDIKTQLKRFYLPRFSISWKKYLCSFCKDLTCNTQCGQATTKQEKHWRHKAVLAR
jgi:hypothetical protein